VFTLGGRVQHACGTRLTREATRICLLGAGLLLASLAPAAAQDPHAEIFTGLDASNNAVSGYLGAGYAFGKGLYAPGWRVRAIGSLGSYDYRDTLFGAVADLGTTFDGDASYGAALLGYQFRADTLIIKLFAGVEAEDQRISPRDPDNAVQGALSASSLWWRVGSTSRRCGSSPPMRRTERRFRNIGASRARPPLRTSAFARARRRRARQ
jgi:Cellulose biosynthesis protein BcsS